MLRLAELGIGGITTKTVGPSPRLGYSNPSIIEIAPGTLLNSVGLANPGIDIFEKEITEMKEKLTIPLIVSVFGNGPEDFATIAKRAEKAGADAVELNVSCPHAEVAAIGLDAPLTKLYTQTVKSAVRIPVFVKLTPNMFDLKPIAKAAEAGGADALVMINTVRALAIDYETGRPYLSHGIGGLSGAAIKPIGVRAVYEIYPHVKIPIIGCGGVSDWKDILEYIYAGAAAVQIGSAFIAGFDCLNQITTGLTQFLSKKQINNIMELRGKAHQYTKELEANPKK
jgi:dihydroorotate dehydrogenase (NAD+) catalytic subunit